MKKCPNQQCGAMNADENLFCTTCATRLEQDAQPEIQERSTGSGSQLPISSFKDKWAEGVDIRRLPAICLAAALVVAAIAAMVLALG